MVFWCKWVFWCLGIFIPGYFGAWVPKLKSGSIVPRFQEFKHGVFGRADSPADLPVSG